MFVYKNKDMNKPVKIWTNDINDIEKECLNQAINLSNLPFIYKHVCLMPDTHSGYGMPIGGVIATDGVVIPNAVGVDIGCGMVYAETDIDAEVLKGNKDLIKIISEKISEKIPVGFNKHKDRHSCEVADKIKRMLYCSEDSIFADDIENMYYQIGTLGGGNHFIELQENIKGKLCIMIHSGSRNFGYKVAGHFNNKAKQLNKFWYSDVPKSYQLAFLPAHSAEGIEYIEWMGFSLEFAQENRWIMMQAIYEIILDNMIDDFDVSQYINAHHNYAALENHFGHNLWVHRKGAILARKEKLGIIPGSMGSCSYIVSGLGNADSFHSSSHGAGRLMSRKKAKEQFSEIEVNEYLKNNNIVLNKKGDVADEHVFAYKDIDEVMVNQSDLTEVIDKLIPILVIKG